MRNLFVTAAVVAGLTLTLTSCSAMQDYLDSDPSIMETDQPVAAPEPVSPDTSVVVIGSTRTEYTEGDDMTTTVIRQNLGDGRNVICVIAANTYLTSENPSIDCLDSTITDPSAVPADAEGSEGTDK